MKHVAATRNKATTNDTMEMNQGTQNLEAKITAEDVFIDQGAVEHIGKISIPCNQVASEAVDQIEETISSDQAPDEAIKQMADILLPEQVVPNAAMELENISGSDIPLEDVDTSQNIRVAEIIHQKREQDAIEVIVDQSAENQTQTSNTAQEEILHTASDASFSKISATSLNEVFDHVHKDRNSDAPATPLISIIHRESSDASFTRISNSSTNENKNDQSLEKLAGTAKPASLYNAVSNERVTSVRSSRQSSRNQSTKDVTSSAPSLPEKKPFFTRAASIKRGDSTSQMNEKAVSKSVDLRNSSGRGVGSV